MNSTWTASSFCGTYHCKVRRKNITNTQYAPSRQLNVTNVQLLGEKATTEVVPKEENIVKKEEVVKDIISTDNKTIPYIKHSNDTLKEIQTNKIYDYIDDKNATDKDRYLSEKEIKSLTEILHTVKKGDLDAIVEIYNLAQDIYQEMDQTSTDLILQNAVSTAKTLGKQLVTSKLFEKVTPRDRASYFYEPLSNIKIRTGDLLRPDIVNNEINPEIPAMVIRMDVPLPSAEVVNVTTKVTTKTVPLQILSSIPIEKGPKSDMQRVSDEFFNSPLSHKDFGKLPYYYPMSNFQRMSSYKHDQKKTRVHVVTLAPVPVTTLPPTSPRKSESKTVQAHARIPARILKPILPRISDPKPPQTRARFPAWILERKPERKPNPKSSQIHARIPPHTYARIPPHVLELIPVHAYARVPEWVLDPIPAQKSEPRPAPIKERIRFPDLPEYLPGSKPSRTPAPAQRGLPIRFPQSIPPRHPKATTLRPEPAPAPKTPHKPVKSKPVATGTKYVKEVRPSIFLPYPFTNKQEHKNWSFIQSLYNVDRLTQLEASIIDETPLKKNKTPRNDDNKNNIVPMKKREKQKQDNVVLMNPDLEDFPDLQIRASMNKENVVAANEKQSQKEERRVLERRRPAWQTDSLPDRVIEEIRAHIQEKHRKFIHTVPIRKKVKLERVGTLFNMDQLTRNKREAEAKNTIIIETAPLEHEIYEVFIEKTM